MKDRRKDILCRALRTFWQAAAAYLLADATVLQEALVQVAASRRMLYTLGIGAVAAGLSAVYNALICPAPEGGYGE